MKKKLLGIFLCTLLIATAIPVVGIFDEKTMTSTGGIQPVPILEFENIKGGLLGISVDLVNYGNGTAYNIEWSMNITEGSLAFLNITLFFPISPTNGEIYVLEPGQKHKIEINTLFGLGQATINFYCKFTMDLPTSREEATGEGTQEWRDQSFLVIHSFRGQQPDKEWEPIEDFSYHENGAVWLYFGIRNMHNVQCVNIATHTVEYKSACCFDGSAGRLVENWFTKDKVLGLLWRWEVQTVDGM